MQDLLFKSISDEKELSLLENRILPLKQFYPNYEKWWFEKAKPRIENNTYHTIIALSDNKLVGNLIYRDLTDKKVEIKNFRIDKKYRRRDIGHFLLKQLEYFRQNKIICTDVTVDNFLAVQFFIRNGFDIIGKEVLYKKGQFEYLLQK